MSGPAIFTLNKFPSDSFATRSEGNGTGEPLVQNLSTAANTAPYSWPLAISLLQLDFGFLVSTTKYINQNFILSKDLPKVDSFHSESTQNIYW